MVYLRTEIVSACWSLAKKHIHSIFKNTFFFGSHDIAGSAPGAWGMTINKPKNVSCPCEACSTIHPHGPLFPPPILLPFREGG